MAGQDRIVEQRGVVGLTGQAGLAILVQAQERQGMSARLTVGARPTTVVEIIDHGQVRWLGDVTATGLGGGTEPGDQLRYGAAGVIC